VKNELKEKMYDHYGDEITVKCRSLLHTLVRFDNDHRTLSMAFDLEGINDFIAILDKARTMMIEDGKPLIR
jgi:hypothetical protein